MYLGDVLPVEFLPPHYGEVCLVLRQYVFDRRHALLVNIMSGEKKNTHMRDVWRVEI